MKYLINGLAVVFFGWPAAAVGYAWASLVAGFKVGAFLYDKHEGETIDKFVKPTPERK